MSGVFFGGTDSIRDSDMERVDHLVHDVDSQMYSQSSIPGELSDWIHPVRVPIHLLSIKPQRPHPTEP